MSQAVKDVLQSLVDDGLVDMDKVGAQNLYWSFASKAAMKRQAAIKRLEGEAEALERRAVAADAKAAEASLGKEDSVRVAIGTPVIPASSAS